MPSYTVEGKKIELEVDQDYVAVKFKPARRGAIAGAMASTEEIGNFRDRIEIPELGVSLLPMAATPSPSSSRSRAAAASLRGNDMVDTASTVYVLGQTRLLPTGKVLCGIKPEVSESTFEQFLADNNISIEDKNEFGEYTLNISPEADVFSVVESISGSDYVDFVEPDFVNVTPRRPNQDSTSHGNSPHFRGRSNLSVNPVASGPDPLLAHQYYIPLIKAQQANAEVQIDPSITIAILDEGCDTTHPDLQNIKKDYDGTDDDNFQEPKGDDAHGTACAGIVGATVNNQLGVRGVAAGCSMLAVRIAFSPNTGTGWITTNEWIARSIDWSWQNGADVISNSWGGGSPSTKIIRAFDRARTLGRSGRGAVVVIAAGNDDGPVSFPATLPEVLAVSASNADDEPKTKTSSDGEHWWGSNFGPEVDVAAPGVHIATTDISGSRGYESGDYTLTFNGTSSACPQVAAVCALILSRDNSLSEAAVRKIIIDTADKVGSVAYDPITNHNPRMGFGRVNALRAVRAAVKTPQTDTEFLSTPALAIPDADLNGVTDSVEVALNGSVKSIELEVDISHTYRGDLTVSLNSPENITVVLHNREGGNAADLRAAYHSDSNPGLSEIVNASTPAAGLWTLKVADLASADVGTLNEWRLKLESFASHNIITHVGVPTLATIPDNDPVGTTSDLDVTQGGNVVSLEVSVEITHPWIKDLTVQLSHADKSVILHNREGESGEQNIMRTYTSTDSSLSEFVQTAAAGDWSLRVVDHSGRDVGKFSRWSLTIETDEVFT